MESKSKRVDFSFFKTFDYLLNFPTVLLLIFGVFLFDSLEIMVYGKGILYTDFSIFFNLSAIPFLLLFMVSFGVIAASLSSIVNFFVSKFFEWLLDKFELWGDHLFKLESKPKITENYVNASLLRKIALITENAFLLEYIEKEIKNNNNVKRNHRVIYSLSIAVILNLFVTFLYNKKTILDFIISSYKNNGFSFINICLSLLLTPVIITMFFGIKYSIGFDDEKIYFPDAKYRLSDEEMKSLLKKK